MSTAGDAPSDVPETDYLVSKSGLTVVKDKDGNYCSCYLLCVDCGDANKNKYYAIQSLTDGNGNYYFHTRFGRVGYVTDANNKCDLVGSLEEATKLYNKTKKAKTGKAKGYSEVKMSLGKPGKDKDSSKVQKTDDNRPEAPSKLPKQVQDLISFITNKEMMDKAVAKSGFDVKKLPLGDLSLDSLNQANAILKNLEDEIKKKKMNESKLQKFS